MHRTLFVQTLRFYNKRTKNIRPKVQGIIGTAMRDNKLQKTGLLKRGVRVTTPEV